MSEHEAPAPTPSSVRNAMFVATVLGLLGVVGFGVARLFDAYQILDDAYFYARYAHHLLTEGVIAWNPGGEPTFGPTSPGWVAVVAVFLGLFPVWPAQALLAASAFCAAMFVVTLFALVARDTPRALRKPALVLVGFAMMTATLEFAGLVTNAMDTALVLWFVATWLFVWVALERRPGIPLAVVAGLLGGLAFSVRADVLLFTCGAPAAVWMFGRDERRRAALVAGAVTVAVVVAQLVAAWLYFGRPLPLSFDAKSTGFFSPAMYEMFEFTPVKELLRFGLAFRVLCIVLAFDVLVSPRRWWADSSPLEKGVAGATVVFVVYYLFFVLQMMGDNARFYFPTLPGLAWLACRSLTRMLAAHVESIRALASRLPVVAHGVVAVLLVSTAFPVLRDVLEHQPQKRADAVRHGRFDIRAMQAAIPGPAIWFGVPEFPDLDGDFTLATTEVGLPGAVCLDHTIADLSGLNEPWMVEQGGFTAEGFFAQHRPDILYMVFETYRPIREELEASPVFQQEYEYHPDLGIGIAIRRDSPHYAYLRALLDTFPR